MSKILDALTYNPNQIRNLNFSYNSLKYESEIEEQKSIEFVDKLLILIEES
jgi:hypothetical protein